jgi:hypothetical protein
MRFRISLADLRTPTVNASRVTPGIQLEEAAVDAAPRARANARPLPPPFILQHSPFILKLCSLRPTAPIQNPKSSLSTPIVYTCTLLKSRPFPELLIVQSLTSRVPQNPPPLLLEKKTLFKKYFSPLTPCLPTTPDPTFKKEPRGGQSMCYNVHVQRGTAAPCADPIPPAGGRLPRADAPARQNDNQKVNRRFPNVEITPIGHQNIAGRGADNQATAAAPSPLSPFPVRTRPEKTETGDH